VNWTREVQQIGSMAAGGIKWNVPEAIEEAYSRYAQVRQSRPAPGRCLQCRPGTDGRLDRERFRSQYGDADIAAVMETASDRAGCRMEDSHGESIVTIVVPLEADSKGNPRGYIATNWSTERLAGDGC
jgi:methyl-accepting chemotaxis protein